MSCCCRSSSFPPVRTPRRRSSCWPLSSPSMQSWATGGPGKESISKKKLEQLQRYKQMVRRTIIIKHNNNYRRIWRLSAQKCGDNQSDVTL